MPMRTSFATAASVLVLASGMAASPAAAQSKPWTLHEAVGAPDNLKLSGSVRARYESLGGQYRPALGDGSDQGLLLRATLFAELDLAPVRIGGEVIDARAYLNDTGSPTSVADVNALELIQAYVAADVNDLFVDGAKGSLTLGRFTMDLGSRRLVGRSAYGNSTNAMAGVRGAWSAKSAGSATLFYSYLSQRRPSDRASILDNEIEADRHTDDLILAGAFYTAPKLADGSQLELYGFRLEENDSPTLATRNRQLTTLGGRLLRNPAPGQWDYEVEGAWQTGTARNSTSAADRRDLDVDAQLLHLEVGRTFKAPWSPRITVEYDFASGDKSSADGEFNRFDGLIGPRRTDFGPTSGYGPIGRSNINSPGVRFEVVPNPRWDAMIFYRALWLDEAGDSFANTGVRDASGRSGDFAGHQVEARARYWIVPKATRLDMGVATLINGEFLDRAPNATGGDPLYGYFEVTQTF